MKKSINPMKDLRWLLDRYEETGYLKCLESAQLMIECMITYERAIDGFRKKENKNEL